MSLTNDFRCLGFCADKPLIKTTKNGTQMAILAVYTHDFVEEGQFISQAHRCLFFGKKAEMIAEKADKGRHIHIRGMIRLQRQGEGQDARYFTNVIVEEFSLSPRQSVEAVKEVLRDMLAKDKITHCEQLGIFQ